MKIEEIQQQCETLSNEQLLLVVNNKRLYTEKIVRIAYQEINKRGISKQEIKEIEKKHVQRSKIITGDIQEDILFLEKIGFFVLCVPRMHYWVLRDYRKKGFVLKVRQAMYFNLLGLIFFFVDILLWQFHHSILIAGIIWVSSFLLTYFFNEHYFRERTIKHLAARTADPETK